MQHGGLAVAAPGCEKPGHRDRPTEGGCLKPEGVFAQSHDSDFNFHQTLCIAFDLRRAVLQPRFADWNTGRCVAQGLALDQFSGDRNAVQPFIPYK